MNQDFPKEALHFFKHYYEKKVSLDLERTGESFGTFKKRTTVADDNTHSEFFIFLNGVKN
jgi:hypothetical protein